MMVVLRGRLLRRSLRCVDLVRDLQHLWVDLHPRHLMILENLRLRGLALLLDLELLLLLLHLLLLLLLLHKDI